MPVRTGRHALACAAAWLCLTTPALAQEEVPGDNGSVDQYAESLPSSDGNRALTKGGPGHAGLPLPASVRRQLPNSPTGRLLKQAASNTALGAPGRRELVAGGDGAGDRPSAASALGGALFGSATVLLVVLIAILALAAVAAAVLRRRRAGGVEP
jgi:hypothetical protein